MKHPLLDVSPGRLLLVVILSILLAEVGERLLLGHAFPESDLPHAFIDMISMLVVLVPIYFIIYRPFQTQWHQRQRMEEALKTSEERLKYALEAINDGVWDWLVPTGEVYFSPRWQTMLGYEPGELASHYSSWESHLHPEDREKTLQALTDHVNGLTPSYQSEYRMRTKDGHDIWILDRGRVVERDSAGKALRVTGTHTDITMRKQAEAALHLLWQQLDRTAENERARLARDLHDHLGQLVTVLQLDLGVFKRTLQEPEDVARCRQLIDLTTQLGHEIRQVTARLRPPALDSGLVPALKYDLENLRKHLYDLQITFQAPGLERQRLEPEVEITLFRIYQEALNNAVKHARARTIDIRLQREGSEILLAVQDDGVGFEPQLTLPGEKNQGGIGLVGMRERVAALGGRLEIISSPGEGTTVKAFLPNQPQEPGETP
ncbi:MAG TPA: PAS domain-containing protein [Desulfuromonadales bacterium]|nr:PAS domain-containing protein [Desulfuromonadales bacterium]